MHPVSLLFLLYPLVCLLLGTVSGGASWAREAGMHAVIVAALGAALVAAWRNESWPLVGGLFEPALVLLLLALMAGALQSPCAGRSWGLILLATAAVSVFYLVLGAGSGRAAALAWLVPATGVVAAGAGLLAYGLRWTPRVAVPLGHHNYMAGFLLLHLPLTISAAGRQGARASRIRGLWLAGAALEALAILLTGSLAAVFALMVFAVPMAVNRTRRALSRGEAGAERGRRWQRYAAGLLLAALILGVGLLLRTSRSPAIAGVRQRMGGIAAAGRDPSLSLENRLRFLRAGLAMFWARPVVGFGAGSVPLVVALYREQVPGIMPAGEVVPQLHDLPVHLLAETGALGLAAAVLLLLTVIGGRSGPAATAVWLYLLFSLSDYQLDLPAILFPLAAITALAAQEETAAAAPAALPRWLAMGGLALAALACVGVLGSSSAAHYYYQRGDPDRALEWDSHCGLYDFQAGARAQSAGRSDQARELYLAAARRMPNVIPAAAQAGSALAAAGDFSRSIPWLERAAALDYYFTLAHFHLGRARLATGDRAGAIEAFSTSLLVQPATVWAEDWSTTPARYLYAESLERALDKLYDLAALYPQSGPWRRWNELGAFLTGRRNLLPQAGHRILFYEVVDSELTMSQGLIVFRRAAVPVRVAPLILLSPTSKPVTPAGLGAIEHLPVVRAIDLLRK
jgi:tetratricopeptide (TPR) repeat protein